MSMEARSKKIVFLQISALITYLSLYMCEGINMNILAILYPPYALQIGLSTTQIGIVQCSFDASSFLSQFMIGHYITPESMKSFYLFGAFFSTLCLGLFGVNGYEVDPIRFFWVSVLLRVAMGVAASLVYACTIPMLARVFPKYTGFLTSVAQTALGFGCTVGPPAGSAIEEISSKHGYNGFAVPFYAFSALSGFFTLLLLALPSFENRSHSKITDTKNKTDSSYWSFLTGRYVPLISVPLLGMYSIVGFRTVAFSPYLAQSGLKSSMGVIFMSSAATFMLSAPLWGILVQKSLTGYTMSVSMLGITASLFLLYLPAVHPSFANFLFMFLVFALEGAVIAGLLSSSFDLGERIATKQGWVEIEKAHLVVSSWCSFVRVLGRIVGSVLFGGILLEFMNFNQCCFLLAVINSIFSVMAMSLMARLGMFVSIIVNHNLPPHDF